MTHTTESLMALAESHAWQCSRRGDGYVNTSASLHSAITELVAERDALAKDRDQWKHEAIHGGHADQLRTERDTLRAQLAEQTEQLERKSEAIQKLWKERDILRAQLDALQSGDELPEPAGIMAVFDVTGTLMSGDGYTADQLRQAQAMARAKLLAELGKVEAVGKVIQIGVIRWAHTYPPVGTHLYTRPLPAQDVNAELAQPELIPVFEGVEPWPHYLNLKVGQRVKVHTGEEGVIHAIRNSTKKYHVLLRPDFGGQYGAWEVTPIHSQAEKVVQVASTGLSDDLGDKLRTRLKIIMSQINQLEWKTGVGGSYHETVQEQCDAIAQDFNLKKLPSHTMSLPISWLRRNPRVTDGYEIIEPRDRYIRADHAQAAPLAQPATDVNAELVEALSASCHTEHLLLRGEVCRCSQCEFVRLRDTALANAKATQQKGQS